MNAARLDKSARLRRVLDALRSSPAGLTTRELIDRAGVCAVNSIAAELRQQLRPEGLDVLCRFERRTSEGQAVYRYRIGPYRPKKTQGELFA